MKKGEKVRAPSSIIITTIIPLLCVCVCASRSQSFKVIMRLRGLVWGLSCSGFRPFPLFFYFHNPPLRIKKARFLWEVRVSGRKGKRWPVGPLLNLLFFFFHYYQIIVVTLRELYREKEGKKKDIVLTRRCIREEEETVFVSCHG